MSSTPSEADFEKISKQTEEFYNLDIVSGIEINDVNYRNYRRSSLPRLYHPNLSRFMIEYAQPMPPIQVARNLGPTSSREETKKNMERQNKHKKLILKNFEEALQKNADMVMELYVAEAEKAIDLLLRSLKENSIAINPKERTELKEVLDLSKQLKELRKNPTSDKLGLLKEFDKKFIDFSNKIKQAKLTIMETIIHTYEDRLKRQSDSLPSGNQYSKKQLDRIAKMKRVKDFYKSAQAPEDLLFRLNYQELYYVDNNTFFRGFIPTYKDFIKNFNSKKIEKPAIGKNMSMSIDELPSEPQTLILSQRSQQSFKISQSSKQQQLQQLTHNFIESTNLLEKLLNVKPHFQNQTGIKNQKQKIQTILNDIDKHYKKLEEIDTSQFFKDALRKLNKLDLQAQVKIPERLKIKDSITATPVHLQKPYT